MSEPRTTISTDVAVGFLLVVAALIVIAIGFAYTSSQLHDAQRRIAVLEQKCQ